MKAPSTLSKEAVAIWNRKIEEIKGVNDPQVLLDNIDAEVLTTYCESYVKYIELAAKGKERTIGDAEAMISYFALIIESAAKLGFVPSSRAQKILQTTKYWQS